MKRTFGIALIVFFVATVLAASALPTMAGRLKSYDGNTGILILELEDKSVRKFRLDDKTKVEWMGRKTHASALREGAKISVQVAGSLAASPLKAAAVVDWASSESIVAKGASAPYHTPVAEYASTSGGGGTPEGAPRMNSGAHQDMAAIGHGGSQNQKTGPSGNNPAGAGLNSPIQSHPGISSSGPSHYSNQGDSLTAPLEMMNIDPYSSNQNMMPPNDPMQMDYPQMGSVNDMTGTLMGIEGADSGMDGMESTYGGGSQKISGQVLESAMDRGFIVLQSFEHPELMRILVDRVGDVPMQLLVPGQMIEVTGTNTPQGFRATQIRGSESGF